MNKKTLCIVCVFMTLLCGSLYCETRPTFYIHEPRGDSMDLVDLTPHLINYQSNIKYPAKWYVREDAAGIPSLFITREPLRVMTDRFKVGSSFYYRMNYFITQEHPSSNVGNMAKAVLRVVDWEKEKQRNLEFWKNEGHAIISHSDIFISGQPALRIDHETTSYRAITIYVKAGINLVVMTFEAPIQEFDSYKNTFEEMVKYFSFKKEFKIIDESMVLEAKTKETMSR